MRNADCHAKNIALYYTSLEDVAYPRYADNPPGLPVDGRQTWVVGKTLERFFKARLGIAPKLYAEMVERLCESAVQAGQEVIEAARNESRWHTVAKQMVHAWNDGMASLHSAKNAVAFRGLSDAIAHAGFSKPEKPESVREVSGWSALLGRPRKR
jgi:serine/threonine-protein kinase HipA